MEGFGEIGMKISQSWKRNTPTTNGYSLTVTYVYSSQYLHEIEDIENKLPKGIIVMDTDNPKKETVQEAAYEDFDKGSTSVFARKESTK